MIATPTLTLALGHDPRVAAASRLPADLRSTSHGVTCDYLVGRRFRVCSCRTARASR
jgi:hypothetical protein